ncbi:MAG: hypothetical protein AAF989_09965 [Planctomycetota bacterium]
MTFHYFCGQGILEYGRVGYAERGRNRRVNLGGSYRSVFAPVATTCSSMCLPASDGICPVPRDPGESL